MCERSSLPALLVSLRVMRSLSSAGIGNQVLPRVAGILSGARASKHVHRSTLPRCSGSHATAAQASAVHEREVALRQLMCRALIAGCPPLAVPEECGFLAAWPPPAEMAAAGTPITSARSAGGFDWHASEQPCNRRGYCSTRLCARWAGCNLLPMRRSFVIDNCCWTLPPKESHCMCLGSSASWCSHASGCRWPLALP